MKNRLSADRVSDICRGVDEISRVLLDQVADLSPPLFWGLAWAEVGDVARLVEMLRDPNAGDVPLAVRHFLADFLEGKRAPRKRGIRSRLSPDDVAKVWSIFGYARSNRIPLSAAIEAIILRFNVSQALAYQQLSRWRASLEEDGLND